MAESQNPGAQGQLYITRKLYGLQALRTLIPAQFVALFVRVEVSRRPVCRYNASFYFGYHFSFCFLTSLKLPEIRNKATKI
jgi:hypothetical protein